MSIELQKLVALVQADISNFNQNLDAADAKARAKARAIEEALDDLDIRFDLQKYDRQIAHIQAQAKALGMSVRQYVSGGFANVLDENARKAAIQLENLSKASARVGKETASAGKEAASSLGRASGATREFGQALENLAQGDPAEALVELGAGFGVVGVAVTAATLLIVGAGAALAKLTQHVIDNAREIQTLAKEHKLSAEQVQALQVMSNLTGQSVDELADRYKEIQPEVARYTQMVRESGAVMDKDLRAKANDAAIELERFKLKLNGIGNEIARGFLPILSSELAQLNDDLKNNGAAWESVGEKAGLALAGIIGALKSLREESWITLIGSPAIASYNAYVAGSEAAKRAAADRSLAKLYGDPPKHEETRRLGPKPAKAAGADQQFHAELELRRQQAENEAKFEQDNIRRILEMRERSLAEELRLNGENHTANIAALERYYGERIRLQQQSIEAEIAQQEKLLGTLVQEEQKARNKAEKLRAQAQQERVRGQLQILGAQVMDVQGREAAERDRRIREERERERADYAKLTTEIRGFQNEMAAATSPAEAFRQELERTVAAAQQLALALGDTQALKLIQEYKQFQKQRFNDSQLPGQYETASERLNLGRDRIQRLADRGLISEGQARQRILALEREMQGTLRENLNLQIQIARAHGDELTALRLERELDQVEQLGHDHRQEKRLKDFNERLGGYFDEAIDTLISGGDSLGNTLRNLARNILSDFFRTLQESLIESLTDGKHSSIGSLLGSILSDQLSGIFDRFRKKPAAQAGSATRAASDVFTSAIGDLGGKVDGVSQTVKDAAAQQTATLGAKASEQSGKLSLLVGGFGELASALTSGGRGGFWSGLLGAALGGFVSGLTSGLLNRDDGGGGRGDSSIRLPDGVIDASGGYGGKRAQGGHVVGGWLYQVNENGPEYFRPDVSGSIMPHHALPALTGAAAAQAAAQPVTVINHFHITTPASHVSRESQQQIAARTSAALNHAQRRNGR
ncbi:MAG: hypothetical protein U0Z53_23730 [Blastocatellia bacterium]